MPSQDNGHGALPPAVKVRAENCPMCTRAMAVDDHVICCAECGEEGCTEFCIPGGRGTACTDCEDDGA